MNKDESIAVGHTDFENTLTPEEAEEFDRLAEKLAPTKTYTPPPITGYRVLSQAEVDLVNEAKALAEQCGAFIAKLRGVAAESAPKLDQRWISIGATDLQCGFMAVIRGITQPTTF